MKAKIGAKKCINFLDNTDPHPILPPPFWSKSKNKVSVNTNKLDHESAASTQAKVNDKSAKANAKQYADRRNKAKERDFQIGDKVLVKSEKGNKFTTPYEPEPHTIQANKGSMLTAASKGKVVTRNSSFFKKLPDSTNHKPAQHQSDSGRPSRKKTAPKYLQDFVRD